MCVRNAGDMKSSAVSTTAQEFTVKVKSVPPFSRKTRVTARRCEAFPGGVLLLGEKLQRGDRDGVNEAITDRDPMP